MSTFPNEPAPPAPRSGRGGPGWALFLLVAAAAAGLWWRETRPAASGLDPDALPRAIAPRGDRSSEDQANIQIYETVSPAVAQVTSLAQQSGLYGLNVQEVPKGVGSGFVWDTEGHIVTNYHVVEGADGAKVTLADHSTYDASAIWADPDKDMAVLWINADKSRLHPVKVGTSHDLKVGQCVYALGDPFGLDLTMTTGIVSALGARWNRQMAARSRA